LWNSSYRSSSVRPKNIPVKPLSFLVFPKLPKHLNQPRTSWFSPQNPPNDFWSSSYRSPSVLPKNIPVKTLSLLVFQKLLKRSKLSNQPTKGWFCTKTPPNDFWNSSYHFSISITHKYFSQNFAIFVFPKVPKLSNQPRVSWFCPQNPTDDMWSSSYRSPSVWPKNILIKTFSLLVYPKLPKLSNQPRMSWFCPQNPLKWFVQQFLCFSISTAQKYFDQNFVTFGLPKTSQTCQTFKPTHNGLVMPPKSPALFLEHFLSFSISTAQKYFGQNFVTFGLPKHSNQPRMRWFCPQNPLYDFVCTKAKHVIWSSQ